MLVLLYLGCFVFVVRITAFNLDFEFPVLKQGPSNSAFGFSVAQHQTTVQGKVEHWIYAGAPRANNTYLKGDKTPGSVFKCNATDIKISCADSSDEERFDGGNPIDEIRADQWLGVSLKSLGKDKSIVSCAHRYISTGDRNNFRLIIGKCTILEPGRGPDIKTPCSDLYKKFSPPSFHNYGYCMTGIGLDAIAAQSSPSYFMGSVGAGYFRGRVQKPKQGFDPMVEFNPDVEESSSHFGYSVAVGAYLDKSRQDIASGGPRFNNTGGVAIFSQSEKKRKFHVGKRDVRYIDGIGPLFILPNKDDQIQIGSGFGYAVCAVDADNDKYAELLVGAPFHTDDKTSSDIGIIYIYKRESKDLLRKSDKTISTGKPRAAFGSAIVSAGDLNLDGHDDVVIGAPYEDEGKGAVYIYQGTKKGLRTIEPQRIQASKIRNGLRAFGRSMAGGMDMDNNGYKDVLVGAYASDHAVLLRSRPVIKIFADIEFSPKSLNPSTQTKFTITIKSYYTEKSGKVKECQAVNVKLVADRREQYCTDKNDKGCRIYFVDSGTAAIDKNISVCLKSSGKNKPLNIQASLKSKTIQKYPDVKFKLVASLRNLKPQTSSDSVTSLNEYPVLEKDFGLDTAPTVNVITIPYLNFTRDCNPCQSDLSVKADTRPVIRLGSGTHKFNILIENNGKDPAFSVKLSVTIPSYLPFNTLMYKGKTKSCTTVEDKDNKVVVLTCENLIPELKKSGKENATLILDTSKVSIYSVNRQIHVNVTSASEIAGKEEDNSATIEFEVRATVDLRLVGIMKPKVEFYGGKVIGESAMKTVNDIGYELRALFTVENNGPDLTPEAELKINWPYEVMSGKHLFYLVGIQKPNRTDVECTGAFNILNKATNQPSALKQVHSHEHELTRSRRNVPDNFTIGRPTQQTTMAASTELKQEKPTPRLVTRPPTQKLEKMEGTVLLRGGKLAAKETLDVKENANLMVDCQKGTARCTTITCKARNLPADERVQITVIARIWNSTFLMDYGGQTLSVVTRASLGVGKNLTSVVDPNLSDNKLQVFVVLKPEILEATKKKIKLWIYIVAALSGVVLLVLCVLILKKLGFFKRYHLPSKKSSEGDDSDVGDSLLKKRNGQETED